MAIKTIPGKKRRRLCKDDKVISWRHQPQVGRDSEQSQEEPKSVRSRLKEPLYSSLFSPAVLKNTLTNNNVGEARASSS